MDVPSELTRHPTTAPEAVSVEEEVATDVTSAAPCRMEWVLLDPAIRCPPLTCMRLCRTAADIHPLSKAMVPLLKVWLHWSSQVVCAQVNILQGSCLLSSSTDILIPLSSLLPSSSIPRVEEDISVTGSWAWRHCIALRALFMGLKA